MKVKRNPVKKRVVFYLLDAAKGVPLGIFSTVKLAEKAKAVYIKECHFKFADGKSYEWKDSDDIIIDKVQLNKLYGFT